MMVSAFGIGAAVRSDFSFFFVIFSCFVLCGQVINRGHKYMLRFFAYMKHLSLFSLCALRNFCTYAESERLLHSKPRRTTFNVRRPHFHALWRLFNDLPPAPNLNFFVADERTDHSSASPHGEWSIEIDEAYSIWAAGRELPVSEKWCPSDDDIGRRSSPGRFVAHHMSPRISIPPWVRVGKALLSASSATDLGDVPLNYCRGGCTAELEFRLSATFRCNLQVVPYWISQRDQFWVYFGWPDTFYTCSHSVFIAKIVRCRPLCFNFAKLLSVKALGTRKKWNWFNTTTVYLKPC